MPVSADQWKVTVGLNNAACSYALRKCGGKKAPRNFFCQLLLFLIALVSQRVGLTTDKFKTDCDVATPTTSCTSCIHAHNGKGRWFWLLVGVAFYTAVLVSLLYLAGDVETNPGPDLELVPGNLSRIKDLLQKVKKEWYELGVQLGIDETTLKAIRKDSKYLDQRFEQMLSAWLAQTEPAPSWEGIVTALELSNVKLANEIRVDLGLTSAVPVHKSKKLIEVYKRAIRTKATLYLRCIRFNHIGIPQSGKTSFIHRLMGYILNILQDRARGKCYEPSTGVMEERGHILIYKHSHTSIGIISSNAWSMPKDLVAETFILNQLVSDDSAANDPSCPSSKGPYSPSTDATVASLPPSSTARDRPASASRTTDEDLEEILSSILESGHFDEAVEYPLGDTTLLINSDTGGQAEFFDMYGAFVAGPCLNFLYSRLCDELDSVFKVSYINEEGESTEAEDSTLTQMELLFQALSSITCYSGSDVDSKPKVMFVGTHRDKVTEEEFETKDALLQKKLENTEFYERDIVEYASEDHLMLAVDNLNGGQEEIDYIRSILERVIERSFPKVRVPVAWFLLSLLIRNMEVRTLSLEECEKLALKLSIDSEELQEALWFLHHTLGVLLYYPEVEALKGTVICDHQVVYDSVTNLIKKTFTFDNVGKAVSKRFRRKAQFSLNDVQRAASHFTSALPLESLIALLQHFSILTPMTSALAREVTYFMPCVLKNARGEDLFVPKNAASDPLMLRYDCGFMPVGVFPSMITNLISQRMEDWRMIEEGILKNRVQFLVGVDFDTVTFISHPQYFEMSISRNQLIHSPVKALHSVCAHVRDVIQSTLKTVTSYMNYNFSMGYKFGFKCPIHSVKDHLCVIAREKSEVMECLQNKELILLEPEQKVWFEEVPVPKSVSGKQEASPADSRRYTVWLSWRIWLPLLVILLAIFIGISIPRLIWAPPGVDYSFDCHEIRHSNYLEYYLKMIDQPPELVCDYLGLHNCIDLKKKGELFPFHLARMYWVQNEYRCWEDIVRLLCEDFNHRRLAIMVAMDHGINLALYCSNVNLET